MSLHNHTYETLKTDEELDVSGFDDYYDDEEDEETPDDTGI